MATNNGNNNAPNPNVAAHDLLINQAGSPATGLSLGVGQVPYGQGSSSDPIASTLTSLQWVDLATTTQAAAVNTGYIVTEASATTITLPATAAEGSVVGVVGKGAGGWTLAANTGQTIKIGNETSTSGGSLASTLQYDCVEVICITANTTWVARSMVGNITYQ